MTIKRIRFAVAANGSFGDTGFMNGELQQIRWVHVRDTGVALRLTILPSEGDTGHGFDVWTSDTGTSQTTFTAFPRARPQHGTGVGGASDTGWVPYVAAGDKLRLKGVIKGDTGICTGTLYCYYRE